MAVVPYLVVAGITIPVAADQSSTAWITRGKFVRAVDNSGRSTIDPNAKREDTVTTIEMLPSAVTTLMAAARHGAVVACSGRLYGTDGDTSAGPVSCTIEYAVIPNRWHKGVHVRQILTFTLRQV